MEPGAIQGVQPFGLLLGWNPEFSRGSRDALGLLVPVQSPGGKQWTGVLLEVYPTKDLHRRGGTAWSQWMRPRTLWEEAHVLRWQKIVIGAGSSGRYSL